MGTIIKTFKEAGERHVRKVDERKRGVSGEKIFGLERVVHKEVSA